MSAEASGPLRPGDVVEGRYQVDRLLGMGGMGVVVAAFDLVTGARVAVKSLLPELCALDEVVARFHREARATIRLQSEHVTRVFATGSLPNGAPFIVMEYLEGRDLKSLVRGGGPLPIKDVAAYVSQACVALAEAHALGIVHRDLKPANLYLTRRPDGAAMVKVLDFGIAKFSSPNVSGDQLEMTRTQAMLGSRAYMSPEQMLSPKEVDARADIWALGTILYFLAAGKNPFAAETAEALVLKVVQEEPPPLSSLRPDLPPGFEALVMRCLEKDRGHRFANVSELARALLPHARADIAGMDRETVPLPPPSDPVPLPLHRSGAGASERSSGAEEYDAISLVTADRSLSTASTLVPEPPQSMRAYAFSSTASVERTVDPADAEPTRLAEPRPARSPVGLLSGVIAAGVAAAVAWVLLSRGPALAPSAPSLAVDAHPRIVSLARPVLSAVSVVPPVVAPAPSASAPELAGSSSASIAAKAPAPKLPPPSAKAARPRAKAAPPPDSPW